MPITARNGLTYKDLVAQFLGEPETTSRNLTIENFRHYRYTEEAIRAYWQTFDAQRPTKGAFYADLSAREAAVATGGFCTPERRTLNAKLDQLIPNLGVQLQQHHASFDETHALTGSSV